MARSLRLEYEDAIYHVTSRGNERQKIFFSARDYAKFQDCVCESLIEMSRCEYCFELKRSYKCIL